MREGRKIPNWRLLFWYLGAMLLLSAAAMPAQPAIAQDTPPQLPHFLWGTVTVAGNLAPGSTISVKLNGVDAGSTTTDASGKYSLVVSGSNGATIDFYVNGTKAAQSYTFSSGAITRVDLSLGGSTTPTAPPPPPPAPSPTPPQQPPSQPAPGGTQQPPSESAPSGAQRPPSEPTPGTAVIISTSLLGQAGMIRLAQSKIVESGVLLKSADEVVSLDISPNTAVVIPGSTLTVENEPSPPTPPQGMVVIAAYRFEPSGASFQPSITLRLKYDANVLPPGVAESSLCIGYWDGSRWTLLTSSRDTTTRMISAQIGHFSVYALLGMLGQKEAPAPAKFTVTDLKVIPSQVTVNESVSIVVAVSNSGASQGFYSLVLEVSGNKEAEQEIGLAAGESKLVTFTVQRTVPGTYKIAVGDKTATFTVTALQPVAERNEGPPILPLVVFGMGATVIIVLIVLVARRLSS